MADYIGLTDPDLRRRTEATGGFFIVEGVLAIERLLALGTWPVRSLLLTAAAAGRLEAALAPAPVPVPIYVAPAAVLREVVGFDLHRGAVASVDRRPPWRTDLRDVLAGAHRIAVLEGVNDHENLGALFRNAAAFGIDAVLLDRRCADPLYRRSVRVSMGHVLAVPFAAVGVLPDALDDAPLNRFTTLALTPQPEADALADLVTDLPEPTAWLLGAEGPGLSPAVLDWADRRVCIPMAPGVDSLNVATAAAIAFSASTRQ